MMKTNKNNTEATYTLVDVGCYVDGSRGIHAVNSIANFVEDHGMKWDSELFTDKDGTDTFPDESDQVEGTSRTMGGSVAGR
jgi:hypothetical protein